MKRCIGTIHAKEPGTPINDPMTATSTTPMTWTAPEVACTQMSMFDAFAEASGRVLNDETFEKGAQSLTHHVLPGGGTFNLSAGHNDGDGPVYVYVWSPTTNKLVLKTEIS